MREPEDISLSTLKFGGHEFFSVYSVRKTTVIITEELSTNILNENIIRSTTRGTRNSTSGRVSSMFKKFRPAQAVPRHDIEDSYPTYNLDSDVFGHWLDQHFPDSMPISLEVRGHSLFMVNGYLTS